MKKGSSTRRRVARVVAVLMFVGWTANTTSILSGAVKNDSSSKDSMGTILQETLNYTENIPHDDDVSWKKKIRTTSEGLEVAAPRFLLGIMSQETSDDMPQSQREPERRNMLRETYLNYYKEYGNPEEYHRICSLHEIVRDKVSLEDCQIAYTFVLGQSHDPPPSRRTELLNASTTDEMIRPHIVPDELSLDILENGKFGKSPTWFRYATLLMKEKNLPFDYIIKTDSDTLLFPARFLRWVDIREKKVNYQRTHIYGGTPLDKSACGWPTHDHCHNMTAPYFHGGGFYFASIDVSEYIVSNQCPRSKLFIPHEDVTMGNYVHSMPAVTGKKIVGFKHPEAYKNTWKHPVKDPKRMRTLWRAYIAKKKERIKAKGILGAAT